MTISVEMVVAVEVETTSVKDSSNHSFHSVRTSLSIIAKLFDQLAFLSTKLFGCFIYSHTHSLYLSVQASSTTV